MLWEEEEEKLFIFPRSDYPNSSLAPDVGKKLLKSRFSATNPVQQWVAVVAGCKKNFK
jgi:hypothetical protein